jgi:hypothetical protein
MLLPYGIDVPQNKFLALLVCVCLISDQQLRQNPSKHCFCAQVPCISPCKSSYSRTNRKPASASSMQNNPWGLHAMEQYCAQQLPCSPCWKFLALQHYRARQLSICVFLTAGAYFHNGLQRCSLHSRPGLRRHSRSSLQRWVCLKV